MNTIKKFFAFFVSIIMSIISLFTTSAFVRNPKLIIEQLKRAKTKKLAQIDEALVATHAQIEKWKKDVQALEIKCNNCNAAIAKLSAANEIEKAGKMAQLHERQASDVTRMRENIDKCAATYESLLKVRTEVETQYDNKISEAESSIVSLAMNRQMIELYTLTGKTLASDSTTESGISAELVQALDAERDRLESELQVRDDVHEAAAVTEITEDDSASAALARWKAAQAN